MIQELKTEKTYEQSKKERMVEPFGCSVLRRAHKWFDMQRLKESPHMLVCNVYQVKDLIPSVVHADNSCRIQTVNEKQNKVLYDILKKFYKEQANTF